MKLNIFETLLLSAFIVIMFVVYYAGYPYFKGCLGHSFDEFINNFLND